MTDRRVVVNLEITEFVDGKIRNRATLRRDGGGGYLTTAERVMHALAALDDLTTDTEASDGR